MLASTRSDPLRPCWNPRRQGASSQTVIAHRLQSSQADLNPKVSLFRALLNSAPLPCSASPLPQAKFVQHLAMSPCPPRSRPCLISPQSLCPQLQIIIAQDRPLDLPSQLHSSQAFPGVYPAPSIKGEKTPPYLPEFDLISPK